MQAPELKRVPDLWICRADSRASVSSPRAPCESGHEQKDDGAPPRRQRTRRLVRFSDAGAGDPAAGRLPSCSARKAQRRHRTRLLSSIGCAADTDRTRREPDVRLLTRECSLLSARARGNQLLGIDLHLVPWCCHGKKLPKGEADGDDVENPTGRCCHPQHVVHAERAPKNLMDLVLTCFGIQSV